MDTRRLNDFNSTLIRCGFGPIGNKAPAWDRLYDELCSFADKERLRDKGVAAIDRGKSPSLVSLEAWPELADLCREKNIRLVGDTSEPIKRTTGRQAPPKSDETPPESEEAPTEEAPATVDPEGAA